MLGKYLKWIFIMSGVIAAGVIVLNLAAKIFVTEISQEVFIEKIPKASISFADINKPAPYFELFDADGNKTKFSDFRNSPLVLVFWTTWNQLAADQIKILNDYAATNKNDLFKLVIINSQEDKSVVLNFVRRGGYSISALLDENGEVGESYQIKTLPTTFFIDKKGIIKDKFTGIMSEEILLEKIENII